MRKLTTREIVVASHNAGKVAEINQLIEPFGFTAKSAAELGLTEPEETGTTFEENSAIKALNASLATGLPALADDSGLCISALEGKPGVYTADWSEKPDGSGRDFEMAMRRIEDEIQISSSSDRSAKFVAVLTLAWPDKHIEHFRGEINGEIVSPPRGELGFGYDPIFKPDGYDTTFGEMSSDQKHGRNPDCPQGGLSHRARAFSKFVSQCLEPSEE